MAIRLSDAFDNDGMTLRKILMNQAETMAGTQPVSVATSSASGGATEGTAVSGGLTVVGGVIRSALSPTAIAAGNAVQATFTASGKLVNKPFSIPEADWQYATPVGTPVTTTTPVAIKAAAGAGIRNYVTGFQIVNTNATASIVSIQDGATVIWSGYVPATTGISVSITLLTPLRGTANTALNFVTATTATSILVSAQGYVGY